MSDDPCAELKQANLDAATEAEAAHSAWARWAVAQQIDRIEDIVLQETGGWEEIVAVYMHSHEAAEKSKQALIAWIECMNQSR
ncbi:MAG: hypothetical protein IH953_02830 [Chloroflexi bacterium]|nr:hypothetical protein [Chloroflexota bacterium]